MNCTIWASKKQQDRNPKRTLDLKDPLRKINFRTKVAAIVDAYYRINAKGVSKGGG